MNINVNILRKSLEKKLKRRGWTKTIGGVTLQGPKREFKTISEEIIWALNESGTPLTSNDLSRYLDVNKKSIQKALRKIRQYPLGYKLISVSRKNNKGTILGYSLDIGENMNIPTVFKMIKIS